MTKNKVIAPKYALKEGDQLIFVSSRWAIRKTQDFLVIEKMEVWGPSVYAFWWPGDSLPRPSDWYATPSWKTNYPIEKIPKTVIEKARKALKKFIKSA